MFLNAIQARGVNFQAVPIHVALRMVLESNTRLAAVSQLSELGFGTSGNIMIADPTGATCLEFSHIDVVELHMVGGQIAHTNHFLAPHRGGLKNDIPWPDTIPRMQRLTSLMKSLPIQKSSGQELAAIESILEDEDGFPTSINRQSSEGNGSSTLFSIAVDLKSRTGRIRLGRPNQHDDVFTLRPGNI